MLKNKSVYNLLELNVAIIFISTSGALGRYIDMSPPLTIAFRALLAGFFILLFCKIKGFSFKVKKEDRATVIWSGLFMGLHWFHYDDVPVSYYRHNSFTFLFAVWYFRYYWTTACKFDIGTINNYNWPYDVSLLLQAFFSYFYRNNE